ncbi:MAG: HipA domain-containing protein [Candidatus Omnitrophica bacterium]|nr:HipA domain-containing protein [Candidatus Omnitrophota bacterium]
MTSSYPIHSISAQPEWIEQMGSKRKFWFRRPDDGQQWLFKFSREGTGEDWAEKIAAEIAGILEISAPGVELAVFDGRRGSISRSFVLQREGWDLIHGNELLAADVSGYQRDLVFRQSQHTLDNILTVLRRIFPDPEQSRVQIERLAGYLTLDALVGNTDRHHENWGVLRRTRVDGSLEDTLAPSFDHASSLGREMLPDERERHLHEGSIETYARRGRGSIYVTTADRRGANPLELVLQVAPTMPEAFQPWLARVRALPSASVQSIIDAVPETLMDSTAKRFATAFVEYTRTQLCLL